jgi:hypothetical protein
MKHNFKSRSQIRKAINKKEKEVARLKKELLDLRRIDAKFSDRNSWFEEIDETLILWLKPKLTADFSVGYKKWKERFVDESTGKKYTLTRRRRLTLNGNWDMEMELAKAIEIAISKYKKENPTKNHSFKNAVTVNYLLKERA